MEKYPKIQTVYLRDSATKYTTLLEGEFARPEFEYLKDCQWVFTEKVDGTNIRVFFNPGDKGFGYELKFEGRTDNAQIPAFLYSKLQETFATNTCNKLFKAFPENYVTLYGEGYGAKIQKGGGNYIPDGCDFILFDVMINGNWLERESIEDIAEKLGIKVVPIIGGGTLMDGIELVKNAKIPCINELESKLRGTLPEGLVMRSKVELKNRRGERVITKLKVKDFI